LADTPEINYRGSTLIKIQLVALNFSITNVYDRERLLYSRYLAR